MEQWYNKMAKCNGPTFSTRTTEYRINVLIFLITNGPSRAVHKVHISTVHVFGIKNKNIS